MYRNYVNKRSPIACWICDDTVPFQEYTGSAASGGKKSGTSDPTKSVPLVSGAAFSSVFKSSSIGQFAQNIFKQGLEHRPFAIEAWFLPIPKTTTGVQQVLSHDGVYDGLSINGKVVRFGTAYLTEGTAYCDFDLQEYRAAYVVGIHNADQNQLWVNAELVASVDITDAQKADTYIAAADGNLYCGNTSSNQEIAINAVGFYPSLTGDQIMQNYLAGIDVVAQSRIAPQFGGQTFDLSPATGSIFLEESWVDKTDFETGVKSNVEIAPDQINPSYSAGVSIAGSWTVGVALDAGGDTSIYGVFIEWSGKDVTVTASLDGASWSAVVNGALTTLVPNAYNPTNKDLQIKVAFAGGLADDPAYLESLSVTGYRNNNIDNSSNRTVTASYPAVMRGNYEPILYRDSNGINLNSGTLTIGTDATADPDVARTLELWIKPLSGTPTISVSGTKYRNGVSDSTLPVGEWSLIHYVAASDIATSITVTGDCIIGQAVLYPTALSSGDVDFIYKSYTGTPVISFVDSAGITIAESGTPTSIYAHDWAIDGAG